MSNLQLIHEHFDEPKEFEFQAEVKTIFFRNDNKNLCFQAIQKADNKHHLFSSYYIGVDWIEINKTAVYVQPKINKNSPETDYLKMLFTALKQPDAQKDTKNLFEIKFDAPYIAIDQEQDLLTPLLVVHFLQVMKTIVRKGLKKSYYKVENNLNGRVKGKIVISETLKNHLSKNNLTHTVCRYEEFGYNGLENRLLKKTLLFVQRYLPATRIKDSEIFAQEAFNFILPAFINVDDAIELNDIKHTKINSFYKEYTEAIRLARLILKRFGYNISSVDPKQKIKTPPFWIDMTKLFELYVLSLLRERFGNEVQFQKDGKYGTTDYIITRQNEKMIIDAKYKPQYKQSYEIDDIRQLSGYARDIEILRQLGVSVNEIVDCLIIYPNQTAQATLKKCLKETPIEQFTQFYKTPIKLPVIGEKK